MLGIDYVIQVGVTFSGCTIPLEHRINCPCGLYCIGLVDTADIYPEPLDLLFSCFGTGTHDLMIIAQVCRAELLELNLAFPPTVGEIA